MTFEEFRSAADEPETLSAPLRALWLDAAGQWDLAHERAQDEDSAEAAWVHAYLHRKEGDVGNARYWYGRAGREVFSGSLQAEWEATVHELLQKA